MIESLIKSFQEEYDPVKYKREAPLT